MQLYWIWLATRPELKDREKLAVLEYFGGAEDIYFAPGDAFSGIDNLSTEGWQSLQDKELKDAKRILGDCARKKISILTWEDSTYPSKLRNIPDPPLVLYYKGSLPDFDEEAAIGIVGTRKASAYGLSAAARIGKEVAQGGGLVVSGMAAGIDAVATEGALSQGKAAVGVLGCGVDRIYPFSNRALFRRMEQQGCLISEYPPGTPPNRWNFPRRNRIISGVSNGTVVVEAPEVSGALITARQSMEQGRDVFVVPGNIDAPTCAGSNKLLRDGAMAALCGWDVLREYEALYPDKLNQQKTQLTEQTDKKDIDNPQTPSYIDLETTADLSDDERTVLKKMKSGEQNIDDVIAGSGIQPAAVLAALTMLEIKGRVQTLPGRRVMKK